MNSHVLHRFTLVIGLLSCLISCRSDPPGEAVLGVPGLSDRQIIDMLAQRADKINQIMSAGTMRVETADDAVTLDIALLASGDRQLRLRAWKLGRAVFDLTRDGEDLWLWHAEQEQEPSTASGIPQETSLKQISAGWRLISGQVFDTPPDGLTTEGPLTATYNLSADGEQTASAHLTIDRTNQTVTRITICDAQGQERAAYVPTRYRLIDGIPWPTKLELHSDELQLEITLDDIEINSVLPASAFTPPRDARNLP